MGLWGAGPRRLFHRFSPFAPRNGYASGAENTSMDRLMEDRNALGVVGTILIVVLVLIVLGVIGFQFTS
jgi:hypothetical protein